MELQASAMDVGRKINSEFIRNSLITLTSYGLLLIVMEFASNTTYFTFVFKFFLKKL